VGAKTVNPALIESMACIAIGCWSRPLRPARPTLAGMNTTKRYATKLEWARAQVADIDSALRSLDGYTADWKRRRARDAGRSRLLERRARMARIVGLGADEGPTPF